MSLLNWGGGFAAAGQAVSDFAGKAGLEQQKADLEQQQTVLASQLAGQREHVGRVEAGDIAAAAAEKGFGYSTALEGQRAASATNVANIGATSATNVANIGAASAKTVAGIQVGAKPPEVKEAEWYASATPEQRQAYSQALLAKAGLPLWLAGDGGASDKAKPAPVTGSDGSQPAHPGPTKANADALPIDGTPSPSDGKSSSDAKLNQSGDVAPQGTADRYADALAKLPAQAAPTVKMMIEGRMAPPTSFALSKPYWQTMLQLASSVDPTFDETTWAGRNATRKDFAAGQSAKAVTAINTALGHAGVVSDSFDELGNMGGVGTPLNAPKNWLSETFGGASVTNSRQAVGALASEARKVFAASGGGNLTELENWEKNFPIDGSPVQQKGAMKEFVSLLDSRLSALSDQYNRGMGRTGDPMDLLQPHAREVYESLTGRKPANSTGYQTGKTPGGPTALDPKVINDLVDKWTSPNSGQK